MIEHLVVIQARPGREDEVTAALEDYARAIRSLPSLLELTVGRNINDVSKGLGWTHGMLARLRDYEAFEEEYWPHPAHAELMPVLDETCETRFGVDYEVDTGS